MPDTSLGITYPAATSHARLWEHIQAVADDVNTLLLTRPEQVRGRVKDTTGSPIATAETVEKTLTLAIPATWVTYDVEVDVSCYLIETIAATGNTTCTLRVRKTNTAGAEWGKTVVTVADAPPSNGRNGAFSAYAEGETATGTITVAFTAIANLNNGLINWDELVMKAVAIRTS